MLLFIMYKLVSNLICVFQWAGLGQRWFETRPSAAKRRNANESVWGFCQKSCGRRFNPHYTSTILLFDRWVNVYFVLFPLSFAVSPQKLLNCKPDIWIEHLFDAKLRLSSCGVISNNDSFVSVFHWKNSFFAFFLRVQYYSYHISSLTRIIYFTERLYFVVFERNQF